MITTPVTIKKINVTATMVDNTISTIVTVRNIVVTATMNYGLSQSQVDARILAKIDSELSETSENALQNKVIYGFLQQLAPAITISDVTITWDSEAQALSVVITATGGLGTLTKTYEQTDNLVDVTVTDEVGTQATSQEDLDDISPIVIATLTYIVSEEIATITCVASGGFGDLTYKLYLSETLIETNQTGIFEVETEGTYTVIVSDQGGASEVSDTLEVSLLDEELQLFLNGLTTPLDSGQIQKLNTLFVDIKTGLGISTLAEDADVIILTAGTTEESSLKNLVKNDFHLTNYGTTFVEKEGWKGNATDQYLELDFIASSDAVRYQQNDACIIALSLKKMPAIQTDALFGGYRNAAAPYSGIVLRTHQGTTSARMGINSARNSSQYNVLFSNYDNRGYWRLNRSLSTEAKLYLNKEEKATQSITSAVLTSIKPVLLAEKIDDTVALHSGETISFLYMGKSKTAEQEAVIIDAVEKYMISNNKSDFLLIEEQTIKASAENKHYGFSATFFLGSRIFTIYRDGTTHMTYDGKAMMIYSDDYGVTWSEAVEVYTGSELVTEAVLAEDPLATSDARDFRVQILDNNTIALFGFVGIGHNTDNYTRVSHSTKSICIIIPYSGTTLNIESKTINYIDDNPFGGGFLYDNNVLYSTTYANGFVNLYKSTDRGATWVDTSNIFSQTGNYLCTECVIAKVGTKLYCYGRGSTKTIGCESSDNGETWTNYTEIDRLLGGASIIKLDDDTVILNGRGSGTNDIVLLRLNEYTTIRDLALKVASNPDIGYGSILKEGDHYYITYGFGDRTDGQTVWSDCGVYFKKILSEYIENI